MITFKNTFLAIGVFAALLSGCDSGSKSSGTVGTLDHNEAWLSEHGEALVAGTSTCADCHGSSLDGGTAGVACAECHGASAPAFAGNPDLSALVFTETAGAPLIEHPTDFDSLTVTDDTIPFYSFDATRHGFIAKADHADDTVPVGFEFCGGCHTPGFTGLALPTPPFPGASDSCLGCHNNRTPHSPDLEEWASYHHITTNTENTEICAFCHSDGRNSPLPPPDFISTVSNNCFNGMLCHTGNVVTTPIVDHFDNHWQFHQQSPQSCKICHGDDFQGRGAAPACFSCHNGNTAPVCTSCHAYNGEPVTPPAVVIPPAIGGRTRGK